MCELAGSEGAYDTAITLGEEALAVHRQTGHRLGEARTLVALGRALHKTKDAAAGPARHQALAVFSDVGVPVQEYGDLDW
ncbi:hypothetical protein AB0D59_04950 [Streptomyces sp. NPDC048417]|uniref:hypothetical protein n=1 Tax=Streptomyces sp. NPDC048417 TaxID=3155387 RepID=UPI003415C4DE